MSVTDEVLQANRAYVQRFNLGRLPRPPRRRLVVVACMDARQDIAAMLGLQPGDAHVIRNAGGIVTEDVMRSLVISHHLQGTQEFILIGHTDCGLLTFTDDELMARLQQETGAAVVAPERFYAFSDLEANLRQQIQKVKTHPWIPDHVSVRGFIYDVQTGCLDEVPA